MFCSVIMSPVDLTTDPPYKTAKIAESLDDAARPKTVTWCLHRRFLRGGKCPQTAHGFLACGREALCFTAI